MQAASEILIREQLVPPEVVERAQAAWRSRGGTFIDILVEEAAVTHRQVTETVSRCLQIPFIEAITADIVEREALAMLNRAQCLELQVMPLCFRDDGALCFALSDPTDLGKVDDVRFITGKRVEPILVMRETLEAALHEWYPAPNEVESKIRELDAQTEEAIHIDTKPNEAIDLSGPDAYQQAPVIALVNLILKQAIQLRASDIHVEPSEKRVRLRYRVDGVLREMEAIPVRYSAGLITRFKVLARVDISEKRVPQDGAFTVTIDGRRVDLRVSTFPTVGGEKIVLRLLDKSNLQLSVEDLGFPKQIGQGVRDVMACHEGIFLVTGPTGSGKSTTLYTLLRELDSPERNIVTLEDPVEYQIETLVQGQANPKAGFTFAAGLRAILRQDPDVVLIGEMRDLETARIGVQASLTGHLVFSTLHTNSALEVVVRLEDMGLERFLLSAAVRGALAQRLGRRLCRDCREPYEATADVVERFANEGIDLAEGTVLYRPVGCKACNQIGYRGRVGLYELFLMDEASARMIVAGKASGSDFVEVARANGYRTLREDGFAKVLEGLTSIEEVFRVT